MKNFLVAISVLMLPAIGWSQEEPKADAKGPRSVTEIAREVRDGIVVVTAGSRDGGDPNLGTGFVVDEVGLIATNRHVIGDARPIWVETRDGKRYDVVEVFSSDRNLDLAIVRIKPDKPMQALKLADDELAEGQLAVAIGHPLGLKNSVVSGTVAGEQIIDGNPMWHLAMTIEGGNSGSPLLDMQGNVHGVISRKGRGNRKFGFALKTRDLKRLLNDPNPVSIEQWKTVGQVDPARWKATMGSRWLQRRGQLLVEGAGDGFGGRSLLLRTDEQPKLPFELAVTVKLDNDAGAAGLVFHSDGGDKHYGFYPSAGNIRLTSFEGPSVFSWNVIDEIETEHYRSGDWNEIKVRVEKNRLIGFVNGHEVVTVDNVRQQPGKIGLCKFRDTTASFKHFQFGAKVESRQPSAETRTELTRQLSVLRDRADLLDIDLGAQTTDVDQRIAVLESQARQLDSKATKLRELGMDIHVANVSNELLSIVTKEKDADIDLMAGSLWIAKLDNRDLDVDAYLDLVDRMANSIREKLKADATEEERLAELNRYLFEQNGFHGSRYEYYDIPNSHMDRVIDDREGLPVTLSVLYMSLAKRLDLNIVGVGLPGHFVVRHEPKHGGTQLIDVFERGQELSINQANAMVFRNSGHAPRKSDFETSSHASILSRILNNMLTLAEKDRDFKASLRYLEALVAVTPEPKSDDEMKLNAELRGMRAVFRHKNGRTRAAIDDLDWILEHKPPGMDLKQVRQMRMIFSQ